MPNFLHFLQDLGELYALHRAPNFYEIHPWAEFNQILLLHF
jgi:hypothetical protein